MPKKIIPYKPLMQLVFEQKDEDGNKIDDLDFCFNNYALTTLVEQFGDLCNVMKEYEKKPYDLAAIILYCGVVNNNTDFTLEEARNIIVWAGKDVLEEVTACFIDSLLVLGGDDAKKKFLQELQEMGYIKS